MISVSFLSSYDYCPRKLFLEQVLKLVVVPKEAVVKGSIGHEVHDRINKADESFIRSIRTALSYSEILDKYKKLHSELLNQSIIKNKGKLAEIKVSLTDYFKEAWPMIFEESKERAMNLYNFIKTNKVFGDELWEKLSPKIQTEYYIESEELQLKGVIDKLEIYENKLVKEVVPYELKTGKAPREGAWLGHKLQIGAYVMLLEKNKMFVREAFVKYLDINESRQVMINPFLEKKVLETRDKIIGLFKSKEVPDFCESKSKCDSCVLYEQCHNEAIIKEKLSLIS